MGGEGVWAMRSGEQQGLSEERVYSGLDCLTISA